VSKIYVSFVKCADMTDVLLPHHAAFTPKPLAYAEKIETYVPEIEAKRLYDTLKRIQIRLRSKSVSRAAHEIIAKEIANPRTNEEFELSLKKGTQ